MKLRMPGKHTFACSHCLSWSFALFDILSSAVRSGTCTNPHRLALEGLQNTTLRGINTCNVTNSNRGFLRSLEGKDYVVLLEAPDNTRMITVTTSKSQAGFEFDTFLVAATQCTRNHTLDTVVRDTYIQVIMQAPVMISSAPNDIC